MDSFERYCREASISVTGHVWCTQLEAFWMKVPDLQTHETSVLEDWSAALNQ